MTASLAHRLIRFVYKSFEKFLLHLTSRFLSAYLHFLNTNFRRKHRFHRRHFVLKLKALCAPIEFFAMRNTVALHLIIVYSEAALAGVSGVRTPVHGQEDLRESRNSSCWGAARQSKRSTMLPVDRVISSQL